MHLRTKSTLIVTAFLIFGCFTFSCNNSGKDASPAKLEHVKVAQFGDVFLYMPLYLAQERGFFQEQGIEIEITNTGGDDKTFAALLSKSASFGIADPTFAAIAKEKGNGGSVVASIVNGVPFWGITKNDKVPQITNGELLKGFSVATFPSPSTAYTLQAKMFSDAHLSPDIKQAAFGALIPMLDAKQVDIALELEPNVSLAVKNGARVVYSMADLYGEFAITGVTVTDEMLKTNPELVQRFVNAIDHAEKFAHAHPDSASFFARKKFPDMDSTVVSRAMNRILSSNTLPNSVTISSPAWEKAIQLRKDAGDLQSLEIGRSVLDMKFAQNVK